MDARLRIAARSTSHDADDAVQAVFILLVQRAARMNTRVRLTGWLFESLRYTIRGIHRAHRRRRFHEHAAARSDPRSAPHPASDDTLRAFDAALPSSALLTATSSSFATTASSR
jgi:DNA-directed RNA polymerase specialized sigma24 family protein